MPTLASGLAGIPKKGPAGKAILSQDLLDHFNGFDTSQTLIETLVPYGEPLVIDPQAMQHGGVDLIDVNLEIGRAHV